MQCVLEGAGVQEIQVRTVREASSAKLCDRSNVFCKCRTMVVPATTGLLEKRGAHTSELLKKEALFENCSL